MAEETAESRTIKEVAIPLFQAKGWMKFLGVMNILGGVFMAFSIWGLLIAWLPIWAGVVLYQAASAVEASQLADGRRDSFERGLAKLKTYFMLSGITMLIFLVISLLGVLFGVGMMAMMAGGGMGPAMMDGGY